MPEFSETSLARLRSCHPDLERLFKAVVEDYDCTILEGFRDRDRQEQMVADGRSKLHWPDSKHNHVPSRAVDAAPWPIPPKWGDGMPKELARFYHFAGIVREKARDMDLKLRWGGDWDGDGVFTDQAFDDLVHFELEG